MRIYVDESPAGAGKTYRAINDITASPCKCLFITERIDRFDELAQEIDQAAMRHGTTPRVRRIHSGPSDRGNSVRKKIECLPADHDGQRHVIVLATHAAMLRSDFCGFSGWTIVVDEVPAFLDFEQKCTHLDAAFFEQFYRLDPLADGWSVVTLTEAGHSLSAADVRADESHEHLSVFHSRVIEASRADAARFVLCNLPDWGAMAQKKVQWCWASAFSLLELAAFDRIELLGNRFRCDIGSMLSEKLTLEPIEWVILPPAVPRAKFHHRSVHIHYFSEGRQTSRTLFEMDKGQVLLGEVGAYLAQVMPPGQFIWSANGTASTDSVVSPREVLQGAGLPASSYLLPRQAGTNRHQHHTHAAMIYAAKPSPNLRALLQVLDVSEEAWTKSVEHETILQFVARTSVRDPGNSSPVHLWVFDHEQALYLKRYFDALSHVSATIAHVEDGPSIPAIERRGPKPCLRTPNEDAEYRAERRRRDAERKRRARSLKKKQKRAA